MNRLKLILFFGSLYWTQSSQAVQSCSMFDFSIDASGLHKNCKESGLNTVSGDSYPTLADAFNVNPASVPVRPTQVGVEVIASNKVPAIGGTQYNLSLIRGFQKFGGAISTNADNTFYSNSLIQSAAGTPEASQLTTPATSYFPTLNLGFATSKFMESLPEWIRPTLGIAEHYNKLRNTWGYAAGLSINSKYVSLGLSYTVEPQTPILPKNQEKAVSMGINLSRFSMDLLYIRSDYLQTGLAISSTVIDSLIVTTTLRLGRIQGTFGTKRYTKLALSKAMQSMAALQCQLGSRMQAGYLYNYLPGTHSLGLQMLLF